MSTYSINGTDWFPASVEQVSYMEQARAYFEKSRFIFDNGQIQIVPMLTKDTYILLYPDDTYAYLCYSYGSASVSSSTSSSSKKDKLNFIRECVNAAHIAPIASPLPPIVEDVVQDQDFPVCTYVDSEKDVKDDIEPLED